MASRTSLVTDLGNTVRTLEANENLHSVFQEIPNTHSESACVVNLSQVIELYRQWTEVFPKIRPYYVYKCNYDPELSKLLVALGCGLDCASDKEIDAGLSFGTSPKDIVHGHLQKPASHIKHAKAKGVDLTVFDCEDELLKIKSNFPESRVVIRIRCTDKSAKEPFSKKFGCSVLQAYELLDVAKKHDMKVVGVSFHVGPFAQDAVAYQKALEKARQVFDHAKKIGFSFNILDIGGGFPGTQEDFPAFKKIASSVNQFIDSLFSDYQPDLTVMAEPGRYFGASVMTLVLMVTGVRTYTEDESDDIEPDQIDRTVYKTYYFTDGSYGSFLRRMEPVRPVPLANVDGRPSYSSILYGSVLAEVDKIAECVLPELKYGEWVYFENCGAYSPNFHCEFNGFVRPPRYYIIEEKDRSVFMETRKIKQ